MPPFFPHPRFLRSAAAAVAAVLLAGCGDQLPQHRSPEDSVDVQPLSDPAAPRFVLLQKAVERGWISVNFNGNGREILRAHVRNITAENLEVYFPAGLVFDSEFNQVVLVRPHFHEIAGGLQSETMLHTAATRSSNYLGDHVFAFTGGSVSALAAFLPFIERHPEIPVPAVQTAVLALTENLPLSSFAKFEMLSGRSAATLESDMFLVDVRYIILALQALKDMGYPMERLALTVDPQLQIEAMIDPMAYAATCKYFEIPSGGEWAFWEDYLVNGPRATRHYALYGIARHYPEVALEMLPRWIRKHNLDPTLRISAAQSLASTGNLEAISIIRQLQHEFGNEPELELALFQSAQIVTQLIYNPFTIRYPSEFRLTPPRPLELPEQDPLTGEVAISP